MSYYEGLKPTPKQVVDQAAKQVLAVVDRLDRSQLRSGPRGAALVFGLLGKRGAGKSYALAALGEHISQQNPRVYCVPPLDSSLCAPDVGFAVAAVEHLWSSLADHLPPSSPRSADRSERPRPAIEALQRAKDELLAKAVQADARYREMQLEYAFSPGQYPELVATSLVERQRFKGDLAQWLDALAQALHKDHFVLGLDDLDLAPPAVCRSWLDATFDFLSDTSRLIMVVAADPMRLALLLNQNLRNESAGSTPDPLLDVGQELLDKALPGSCRFYLKEWVEDDEQKLGRLLREHFQLDTELIAPVLPTTARGVTDLVRWLESRVGSPHTDVVPLLRELAQNRVFKVATEWLGQQSSVATALSQTDWKEKAPASEHHWMDLISACSAPPRSVPLAGLGVAVEPLLSTEDSRERQRERAAWLEVLFDVAQLRDRESSEREAGTSPSDEVDGLWLVTRWPLLRQRLQQSVVRREWSEQRLVADLRTASHPGWLPWVVLRPSRPGFVLVEVGLWPFLECLASFRGVVPYPELARLVVNPEELPSGSDWIAPSVNASRSLRRGLFAPRLRALILQVERLRSHGWALESPARDLQPLDQLVARVAARTLELMWSDPAERESVRGLIAALNPAPPPPPAPLPAEPRSLTDRLRSLVASAGPVP